MASFDFTIRKISKDVTTVKPTRYRWNCVGLRSRQMLWDHYL